MKPFPADPVAAHSRFMAAWLEDLGSAEFRRAGSTPRADAAAAASRAQRQAKP